MNRPVSPHRRALLSVSDKTGLVSLATGLLDLAFELVSTGGTARATVDLVERCGAEVVGVAVLMDLAFLPWREALGDVAVTTLMSVGAEPSLDAP